MRDALDTFEIDGVGNNIPFLSAVMDHPKFNKGDITTGFISEEYPGGFKGVDLSEPVLGRLAAVVAAMHRVREIRAARISCRMSNHTRIVGVSWVVSLGERDYNVELTADAGGTTVQFADGRQHRRRIGLVAWNTTGRSRG